MIFYFTGTGNSKYAAVTLSNKDEKLVDIGACYKAGEFTFEIPDGERMGICFPVYYGGLPLPLQAFFDKLELTGKPGFTFAVITCGSTPFACSEMLEKRMNERRLTLDSVFGVKMPDNYVVLYELSDEFERRQTLERAEKRLREIKADIEEEKCMDIEVDNKDRNATKTMYFMYRKGRKTKKFSVDEKCVACGACVERCPDNAIELVNGKPTWVKDRCSHCMACMRCNAIQHGGRTVHRERYTHPIMNQKKHQHH